jgi:hypothetical protein
MVYYVTFFSFLAAPWTFRDVNDLHALLKRVDVQTELRVTPAQYLAGRDSEQRRKMRAELDQQYFSLTSAEREERLHRIWLDEIQAINDAFSPEQQKRLQQLRLQWQSLSPGLPEVLDREITLTAEQRREIQKREAGLREELMEMMWNFHRHSQQELSRSMTPAQRAFWLKLIGEDFMFEGPPGLTALGTLK